MTIKLTDKGSTIVPPRANMPLVSGAAHKTLSTRPEYNNPAQKLQIKPLNDTAIAETIKGYQAAKQQLLPKLQELKQALDLANETAAKALADWQQIATKYEHFDRQEKTLLHEQKAKQPTRKVTKEKSPDETESDKKLAMKFLSKLSPEQQAAILLHLKAQTS